MPAVISNESDFYPWGGELQFTNSNDNHYKFAGKERDAETGLDYFGARYYGNILGRFITPDWAAKATAVPCADWADPQSLNLYTYVRNIPTSHSDSDGHFGIPIFAPRPDCTCDQPPPKPNPSSTSTNSTNRSQSNKGQSHKHQQQATQNTQKADQLKANAKQGKAFEKNVADAAKKTDPNAVEQVTIKTESGVKTKMDVVSKDASGGVKLQEAKSSAGARLTPNQATAHPEIE
jgi:RHS repeat-associated protein